MDDELTGAEPPERLLLEMVGAMEELPEPKPPEED